MPSEHVPVTTWTPELLTARLNLKEDEGQRALDVALEQLWRATTDAYRDVPQGTWDDWTLRVVGAVIGARKRPTGSSGQQTTTEQREPIRVSRDYLEPVRHELVQYVGLGFA